MSALAARDAEILRLTAAGKRRGEIVAALGVSRSVVDNVRGGKNRALAMLPPSLPSPARGEGVLTTYEAACVAIEAARSVDEAKEIADQAEAMRVYARQAKNRGLEVDAAEIRIRAERRLGELIGLQKASVGLNRGTAGQGRPRLGVGSLDAPPLGGASGEPPNNPSPQGGGELAAPPTLAEAGIDKKLSSRAQRLAALPEEDFSWQLSGWRAKALEEGERVSVRLVRGEAQASKAERRGAREAALAGKIFALPDKRYGVILADPEWRFEPYSRATGMDRAADNHYPTSATEAIAARPVADIAAADCVLFLWATAPMLPDALAVMAAWGFGYRSHFVWVKERLGTGYWNRNVHELLLLGVKGDVPAPAPGTQETSVVFADVLAHSQKPAIFAELIERYFPSLPKIELNRRGPPRPGWDAWGDETPEQRSGTDRVANGGEEEARP